jgi:transketolase
MQFNGYKAQTEAYGEALIKLGRENPNIVVLDADLSKSTKTAKFAQVFPERFFHIGIAEANMIGIASGLALCGKIPFVSTFAVFAPGKCLDQLRNAVAYPNLNVKIVVTHGGLTVGPDGATHQSVEDIAVMRSIPNFVVIVPADAVTTQKVIEEIAESYGPAYVRLCRPIVPIIYDEDVNFRVGKGLIFFDGDDVSIVAMGIMLSEALKAAEILKRKGVSARVLDMHTVKPIDKDLLIKAAKETGRLVTCEDHNVIGGLGSSVAEALSEAYPVPIRRVGIQDVFGESGSYSALMAKYGLTAESIANAALSLV